MIQWHDFFLPADGSGFAPGPQISGRASGVKQRQITVSPLIAVNIHKTITVFGRPVSQSHQFGASPVVEFFLERIHGGLYDAIC